MQIYEKFLNAVKDDKKVVIREISCHDKRTYTIYFEYGERYIAYHFIDGVSAEIIVNVSRTLDSEKERNVADRVINLLNENSYLYYYRRNDKLVICQSFTLTDNRDNHAVELFKYLTSDKTLKQMDDDFFVLIDEELCKE